MNLIIIEIELLARDIDLMEMFHIRGYFPSHQYKNVPWLAANPPAAPSHRHSVEMHRASFHLKYYQSNLRAEFLSVRMSLAGEGCSSRVLNICCCSQGKNPGEPKQPLGINQSVCSGFCCSDLLLDDGGGILCPLALIALASL